MKITVILLTYNQEKYVTEALKAVLNQDDTDFELIVGDDASTDGTDAEIKKSIAAHPDRKIIYLRNKVNLGLVKNFWQAVSRSSGTVIIAMAGDDISVPGRVRMVKRHFEQHADSMALFASAQVMHASGCIMRRQITSWDARLGALNRLTYRTILPDGNLLGSRPFCGGAAAYRKDVFTKFDELIPRSFHAEDEICMMRAALLGTVDFSPDVHLYWRLHGENQSFGTGLYRGPKQAVKYACQANMYDQFLADLDKAKEWLGPVFLGDHGRLASAFIAMREEWKLWEVCHEAGFPLVRYLRRLGSLAAVSRSWPAVMRRVWRPTIKMLTPYWLQRILARRIENES